MVKTAFEKLQEKLDEFRDKRLAYLPFAGKYINLLKSGLKGVENTIVTILEVGAEEGGDVDLAIQLIGEKLMQIPLPLSLIWLAPFKSLIVSSLVEFLLRAKPELFGKVIASPGPQS